MTTPPVPPEYVLDAAGRLDFDALYTCCPSCGFVATRCASYVVLPDGTPDLSQPIRLSCGLCTRETSVAAAVAFLTRDAVRRCGRRGCDTDITCPAAADEVICLTCRMHQPGPHVDADRHAWLDRMRADQLAGVHALMRVRRVQP